MSQELYANIGALIGYLMLGATGASAVTFFLFKLFAEKWMTNKFNQQLESFKHEQQKELEQLRFKIGAMMDRTVKLHQREFEILPEAWSKMATAYAAVLSVTGGLQRFADVGAMQNKELDEHLDDKEFQETTKDEIRDAKGGERNRIYQRYERWRRKGLAGSELIQFEEHLDKNGVFIRPTIKQKFSDMEALLRSAYIELELSLLHPDDPIPRDSRKELSERGKSLRSEIEKLVQDRLWDSQEVPHTP